MASTSAVKRAKRSRAAEKLATPSGVLHLSDGGAVMRPFHDGGKVRGPGTGTSDSIPAMLSHGEVVMPADTVQHIGAAKLLATIDATHVPTGKPPFRFGRAARADGGLADPNAVMRDGNSYSGGNVTGNIAINGQAPSGSISTLGGGGAAAVLSTPTPAVGAPVTPAPAFDPASGVGRPNALGSLADTKAQLATLQQSNADTSQAGFSGVIGSVWKAPPLANPGPAPAPGGAASVLSNTAASPPGSITSLRPPRPQAPPAPGAAAARPAAPTQAAAPAVPDYLTSANAYGMGPPSASSASALTSAYGLGKPYTPAMADGGLVQDPTKKAEEDAALAARVASLPVAPMPTPVAAVRYEQPAPMQPMADDVKPALASGGAVSRNVPTPTAAERLATVPESSGGAVFGIWPKPRSQFSTNSNDAALQRGVVATSPTSFAPAPDASTLVPYTSPAGAGRGALNPPEASLAASAPAANQAVARALDNNSINAAAIMAAPAVDNRTKNPNAPEPLVAQAPARNDPNLPEGVTRNGNSFSGSNIGAPAASGGNAAALLAAVPQPALGSMADTERQLANLRASNADTSHAGFSGVLGGSRLGMTSDETKAFFDEANLHNAAARTSWSPRRGYQGDDTAVAAALIPISARAALAQTNAKDMGDTQRALLAERGLDARSRLADSRSVSEIAINQQRLGLEGRKLTLDTARDDRAAAAAGPKLAADMQEAALQGKLINGTPEERKAAAASIAALKGHGLKGEDEAGKALPSSAAQAFISNQSNIRNAQNALDLLDGKSVGGMQGDPSATGKKAYVPNTLLNLVDGKGVDTRAAVANIGSMLVHDRAGAAVTASETPRLMPFIPATTDDHETVKKKLRNFLATYQDMQADTASVYKETGYRVPTSQLRQGGALASPAGAATSDGAAPGRAVVRTGTHNGQRVVQYNDGSISYAN